jgi:hypothetical protein
MHEFHLDDEEEDDEDEDEDVDDDDDDDDEDDEEDDGEETETWQVTRDVVDFRRRTCLDWRRFAAHPRGGTEGLRVCRQGQ